MGLTFRFRGLFNSKDLISFVLTCNFHTHLYESHTLISIRYKTYLSRLMTKHKLAVRPAKTQICLGIRPVWSESSLCAQWVAKDQSFLHADSEDSDQTGRMPRLIWVFAGRIHILLVLSCLGDVFDRFRGSLQLDALQLSVIPQVHQIILWVFYRLLETWSCLPWFWNEINTLR